jgi:hypothetical protein
MAVMQTTTTTRPDPISFRWLNGADGILGLWLFLSPWIVAFGVGAMDQATDTSVNVGAASWNAWILGAVIFVLSLSAFARTQLWQGYLRAALGIWVFIAPWVLGFTGLAGAAWDHWLTGAAIVLVSAGLSAGSKPIQTPSTPSGPRPTMP